MFLVICFGTLPVAEYHLLRVNDFQDSLLYHVELFRLYVHG